MKTSTCKLTGTSILLTIVNYVKEQRDGYDAPMNEIRNTIFESSPTDLCKALEIPAHRVDRTELVMVRDAARAILERLGNI